MADQHQDRFDTSLLMDWVRGLSDPDAIIRQRSAQMITAAGPVFVLQLIQDLVDPDDTIQRQAAEWLIQINPDVKEVIPFLRVALARKLGVVRFGDIPEAHNALALVANGLTDRAVQVLRELPK